MIANFYEGIVLNKLYTLISKGLLLVTLKFLANFWLHSCHTYISSAGHFPRSLILEQGMQLTMNIF